MTGQEVPRPTGDENPLDQMELLAGRLSSAAEQLLELVDEERAKREEKRRGA